MTEHDKNAPQFFMTTPQPCPYLENKYERKVFTYIVDSKATEINSLLTQGGFRRSQNIAYRPICDSCQACVSIRIIVDDFLPNASERRILRKNHNLIGTAGEAKTTHEQYQLFNQYLNARHKSGGMSEMSEHEYNLMVEDTKAKTQIIEYRYENEKSLNSDSPNSTQNQEPLIAVALTDIISDGLSMVYSFFSPHYKNASLGKYIILDHINRAKLLGLPYVYLGYWVEGSKKMAYKINYQPQEHLKQQGWTRYIPK